MDKPATPTATTPPAREIPGPLDLLWRWLNSLPIAIVVMLLLAILSAIGTMIPQEHLQQEQLPQGVTWPQFLEQRYGTATWLAIPVPKVTVDPGRKLQFAVADGHVPTSRTSLLMALGWDRVYFTWYFFVLMLWLSVSAVVCNITRFKRTIGQWQAPPLNRDAAFFTANPRGAFIAHPASDGLEQAAELLGQLRYRIKRGEYRDGQVLYADRGYWKKWALVLLHVAILVLLAGGIIGATYGSKGTIGLRDGDREPLAIARDEGKHPLVRPLLAKLPPLVYNMQQGSFRIDYDTKISVPTDIAANVPPELQPYYMYFVKEFVSTLAVEHDGKTVGPQEVKVNHPLHVERLVVYQSGYQQQGYLQIDYGAGRVEEFPLLPETGLALSARGVMLAEMARQTGTSIANLLFSFEQVKAGDLYEGGQKVGHIGPLTIVHTADEQTGHDADGYLIDTEHGFTVTLDGKPVTIRLSPKIENTSIFSYSRDPGLLPLTLGWILLVIGIAGALYIPFTQVQIRAEPNAAYLLVIGSRGAGTELLLRRLHAMLSGAP
jgi:hypothetical protein